MIDAKRLGLAGGILWGVCMMVMTLFSMNTGYANDWLSSMMDMYPGYDISGGGSIVGLIYGFIDGFVGLGLLGWLYNKLPHSKRRK